MPAHIDDATLMRLNGRANPQGFTVVAGPLGAQLLETSNHRNVIVGGRWGTSIAQIEMVLNNPHSIATGLGRSAVRPR